MMTLKGFTSKIKKREKPERLLPQKLTISAEIII